MELTDSKFKMIAGLGNPGQDYALTRHNIGFLVVDSLAEQLHLSFNKSRFDALFTRGRIHDQEVFLVQPQSFMNRSGIPLQKLSAYFKIPFTDIIVIHDDMDLAFGIINIVQNRGSGGHNGVQSILDAFGRKDCIRVRVGVGHPGTSSRVTGHVLGHFTPGEQAGLADMMRAAVDACRLIFSKGVARAMNEVNARS